MAAARVTCALAAPPGDEACEPLPVPAAVDVNVNIGGNGAVNE